jgi:hypothetical protein
MSTDEAAPALLSRDDLVALITKAHQGAGYGDSTLAGKTLAEQSKLPRLVAENLGAGFGQWDFFPEATEIVDFALAYTSPGTEEDLWTLARAWASDDAAGRRTMLFLVGKEILQHELRRIEVPKLREVFDESRASVALVLRRNLGLAVPEASATKPARSPRGAAPKKAASPPKATADGIMRMPKPEFKRPEKAPPPPPPKRFQHPKFGDGVLVSQDGNGADAKLTIKFASGPKTLLARFVTELPDGA